MDTMLLTPARFDQGMGHLGSPREAEEAGDPYLSDWEARKEAGEPTIVDKANATVASALIALGRVTGDRENTEARLIADAQNAFREVRACASLAARFYADGREEAARRCLLRAYSRTEDIRCFDPDKFEDDPALVPVFADGRKGAITRHKS